MSCLEVATGATAVAVLDVRGLVDALVTLLPPLPPPPSIPGFAAAAATLPPSERLVWMATAMAAVQAHVSALHAALVGTGVWTEAPELLAALVARHATALRDDLWAADGRDW